MGLQSLFLQDFSTSSVWQKRLLKSSMRCGVAISNYNDCRRKALAVCDSGKGPRLFRTGGQSKAPPVCMGTFSHGTCWCMRPTTSYWMLLPYFTTACLIVLKPALSGFCPNTSQPRIKKRDLIGNASLYSWQ